MNAFNLVETGKGLESWKRVELPDPTPGPGEVLIRVKAVSLNPRDLMVASGHFPIPPKEKAIPVSDGAGQIIEVGPGVTRWKVGDRVFGSYYQQWHNGQFPADAELHALGGPLDGMLAELVTLPESGVIRIPDHLSYEEGSTLPVTAVTAWNAVMESVPKMNAGATVLTLGTGGVRFTSEAIITEGADVGTVHKVCANANCPIHHPKQQPSRDNEKWKAEQEKQRREEAIANTTGMRVLTAVGAAVPVRLLKRDLLFLVERLVSVLDESRVATLARQHGIRQKRDEGGVTKTLTVYVRRADEGTLSRLLVEAVILLAASRHKGTNVLRDAATLYKVDTDAIAAKVKQEFAAKARATREPKPAAKPISKAKKAA